MISDHRGSTLGMDGLYHGEAVAGVPVKEFMSVLED